MFREMRRNKQKLPIETCMEILAASSAGVLAVVGDHDYPYAVPLSYVYDENKIFFHCALTGHKLDAIRSNEKISFCVIEQDQVIPEEYTTYYRSVVVFGKAHVVESEEEKKRALCILAKKYAPEFFSRSSLEVEQQLKGVAIIAVDIEYVSGKEARELAEKRIK